jgi:hypothetical protein
MDLVAEVSYSSPTMLFPGDVRDQMVLMKTPLASSGYLTSLVGLP